MKKALLLAVVMLLALSLPIEAYAAPEVEIGEIPIGYCAPFSGPMAPGGVADEKHLELAVAEINEAGGIKVGGKPYHFKLVTADNKFSTEAEVIAARKLIYKDKVNFIMQWGLTFGLMTVSEPEGKVVFSSTPDPTVFGPHTFRHSFGSHEMVSVLSNWLKDNRPGIKTYFGIETGNPTAVRMHEIWDRGAEYFGFKKLGREVMPLEAIDFYPVLTKVLPLKPDLLVIESVPPCGMIVKQARELGYTGEFATLLGLFPGFIEAAGPASEGVISPSFDPESELLPLWARHFFAKFAATYPLYTPSSNGLNYAMGLQIIAQAMEKAGTVDDVEKIIKVLETEEFDTYMGKLFFGAEAFCGGSPRQLIVPIWISEVREGKDRALAVMDPREVDALRDRVLGQ